MLARNEGKEDSLAIFVGGFEMSVYVRPQQFQGSPRGTTSYMGGSIPSLLGGHACFIAFIIRHKYMRGAAHVYFRIFLRAMHLCLHK